MSVGDKHDDQLLSILKEEGQIIPFLDAIFGFLQRRTDFYIVQENEAAKVGFRPGIAERVVRDVFRKWQKQAVVHNENLSSMQGDLTDLVIHEEEVVTSDISECVPETKLKPDQEPRNNKQRKDDISSETHNGADCGNYRWSQTLDEIDIKVPVPSSVVASKTDLRVVIEANRLLVRAREAAGHWTSLIDGRLAHKHRLEEAIWSLVPGSGVTIYLQKACEKWWDRLLESEVPLDLRLLDVSRHVTDLPEEDHMQVERVMLQEQQKREGLVPVKQQEQLETLKMAWNAEGSPFRGTPFDPSVLQLPSS